jgi:FMN reductase
MFPIYTPKDAGRDPRAQAMIDALQACDGVIIASPGYHGSISGMVKNALDYIEDLRGDVRPYLDGRAVGCIAIAAGWQTTGSVLAALRSIVHALRGWPTPLGIAANSLNGLFDEHGACIDKALSAQMTIMADQLVSFAMGFGAAASAGDAQARRNAESRDIIFTPHSVLDPWI